MEAVPGVTSAVRNGGFAMPAMSASSSFQPSHEEWCVVSEQSVRSSANEELERSTVDRSDERLIYEVQDGRRSLDVDFCSIIIDGGLDNDILEQRLHNLVGKREELHNMELELRAQISARSEIERLNNTFDGQIKEHMNANVKLQEQLHEKEHKIHELERRMGEKERELHAIKLDNEAAWAKEGLLREQSKELQSYMRERDNVETERAQHIKQIHDLQEHIQEKERQFLELQEQNRIAQENVIFKDEQIREAHTWISRAQEIDALQTSTNHTLQSELRERTEQYNQFGEMERLHLHVQQLQLEMADAREKSGSQSDVSHVSHTNSNDVSRLEHVNGMQSEVNDNNSPTVNTRSLENGSSETSGGSTLIQNDQVNGVAFAPSSLFGMPTYLPTALHPFVMHHGVPHPSQVTQSATFQSLQKWQNQQSLSDGEHIPTHDHYPEQTEENLSRADSHFHHEALAVNDHVHQTNYMDASINFQLDATDSVVPSPNGEIETYNSIDESHGKAKSQLNSQELSSQFHEALRVDPLDIDNDTMEKEGNPVTSHSVDYRNAKIENPSFTVNASSPEGQTRAVNFCETTSSTLSDASTITFASMGQKCNIAGDLGESYQLDERALLASIARAIGSGGRTRISTILPNRLGKMLAPLHWHDYKKKYGKLDDFVASHPDLFLIEGDYIQLREGAQKTIAATATAAKVAAAAAAAAAPSSFSSLMPSVAVTPMAHSHRSKKFSAMQSQNLNRSTFHVAGGALNDILSKSNDHSEPASSVTMGSTMLTTGNGMSPDRIGHPQNKGPLQRTDMSMPGQKQSRTTGAASIPRR